MTHSKEPRWPLCDEWAVDTDPYNWILYQRSRKKDGTPGQWNPAGFYPSAELLLLSLARKLSRAEPLDADLQRHLEAVLSAVEARAARFLQQLRATPYPTLSEAQNRKSPQRERAS